VTPTDDSVLLVDRDVRRRPRESWREAWSESSGLGGTISALRFAREAIEYGGARALILPVIGCVLIAGAFFAVAVGAAILAGLADTAESQGLILIVASVALSQIVALVQGNVKPVKRLLIAAAARAENPPDGWGAVTVMVPSSDAPEASRTMRSAFPYVETTYYRRSADAQVRAWYGPVPRGSARPDLAERATTVLGTIEHTVRIIHWWGTE
jgi:hypothetical protein